MTLAVNMANLPNYVGIDGKLSAGSGLTGAVPITNGGTGGITAAQARTNLIVPATDGTGATGTWNINITGNAATATTATGLSATLPISAGGTGATTATQARLNLGLPNSLRLLTKRSAYSSTGSGGFSFSQPTSWFEGNTPSFVMYSGIVWADGITDLREFWLSSGTQNSLENVVLGGSSDDTDQGGTAFALMSGTFVLPYESTANFFLRYITGGGDTPSIRIYILGYQN